MKEVLRSYPILLFLGLATCPALVGCSLIVDPQMGPVSEVDDIVNAYTCRCECAKGTREWEHDFTVCLPDDLNPNRGGEAADQTDLENDCSGRVRIVAAGIAEECVSDKIDIDDCVCEPFLEGKISEFCDEECVSVELATDCTNFESASTIPGEEPLCLADGEPMAAAFLLRSTCQVEGEITVAQGDDEDTEPATGVVEFIGEPCPDDSCEVGMVSRIDEVGTFIFDDFGGFFETRIDQMRAIAASLVPTVIDDSGSGLFAAESVLSTGRGRRRDFLPVGPPTNTETAAYVSLNGEPVSTSVDWVGQTCLVDGALLGDLEDSAVSMSVVLTGALVNQPPSANAGSNQSVECTSPDGATITLDATTSTDPDDNIVLTQWHQGGPGGPEIGELEAVVSLLQSLGSTEQYSVTVLDELWQVDQTAVSVSVADTTAPEINCNAPATINPTDGADEDEPDAQAISFAATASDTCDADVNNGTTVPTVESFDCFAITPNGKIIDKTNSCVVELDGDTITIVDSGGVGTYITWQVVVTDASGNEASLECEVEVINPNG